MVDPQSFRQTLSSYPTGVCVVSAQDPSGYKHALVVGSFTSISLDPPLVGFYPAKDSGSWSQIAAVGRFSICVLGEDQIELCQRFASRAADKFGDLCHDVTPAGQPLLHGSLAWLDCKIELTQVIGDHFLAVGFVEAMGRNEEGRPLLFFNRAYHRVGGRLPPSAGS